MDFYCFYIIRDIPKGLCGQLAAQFLDISIFSGKVKERTSAAKETLLQSALRWPTLLPGRASQSLENWEFQVTLSPWEISSPLAHKSSVFSGSNYSLMCNTPVSAISHSWCGNFSTPADQSLHLSREISRHLMKRLASNLVQTFMVPEGSIPLTLMI